MDIKAVFFDVDGTLVRSGTNEIDAETLQALWALRRRGIKLFLSTGRHMTMLHEVINQFEFDGYITVSGQFCLCGGRLVYKNPIPREGMEQIISAAAAGGFSAMFLEGEECWLNMADRPAQQFISEFSLACPPVCGTERGLEHDVYQVIVMLDKQRENLLLDHISHASAVRWHPGFLDVMPPGGGKDAGVRAVLGSLGLEKEQAMAFGDGENDISMLRCVGLGVAMGNAGQTVKDGADYVTGTVDAQGLVHALKRFGLV